MFGQGGLNSLEGIGSIAGFAGSIASAWGSTGGDGRDTAGRLLETATAVLALIPGWGQAIAAIAQLVNGISGGKLFGTEFEITGGQIGIEIGQTGGTGTQQTRESRQRSLFRGTERRTTENPLDGDVLAIQLRLDISGPGAKV